MTLLEGIVALVIVSLSAIGILELFQRANQSAMEAQSWALAATYAEEGIEAGKLGDAMLRQMTSERLAPGFSRAVRADAAGQGLLDVSVVVGIPGGASLVVHRLMPAR